MRNAVYAVFLLVSASTAALAQVQVPRPANPPPAASADFEARESWCMKYTEWFVSQTPVPERDLPDVRPTHRIENELTYCELDPQRYERETLAELGALSRPS